MHHPCLLGVPTVGRSQHGYITPAHTVGRNRHGYIIATFLGSPWWGEINMTTQTLPSGVPMVGTNQYGHITHAIDMDYGGPKLASNDAGCANAPSKVSRFGKQPKRQHRGGSKVPT